MRLNLEVPDWVYVQFRQKIGEGNMSSYVRDFLLLSINGEDYKTILERETDKQALIERVDKLKEEVNIVKALFDEAVNNLKCAETDLRNMDLFLNTKKLQDEKDKKMQDDIKFNTMKEHLGEM
jgi:hypothetical protein